MKLLAEWFWSDRWMGSRGFLLPMEPRGLYREMLTQAWRRGARLPNDHEAIRRAVGCTAEEWGRCWPVVAPFWREDGQELVNETQLAVYAEAKAIQDRASERGRRGAQARLKHDSSAAQARPERVLEVKPPSPSPSPTDRTTERTGAPTNPLIPKGGRPKLESELCQLVQREAELTDRDGAEVMAEVSHYEGARTSKLNPATMSDDRLLNSLLDARARVKRLEEKHERPKP